MDVQATCLSPSVSGRDVDGSMKTNPVLHSPSGRVWTQLARQTQLAGPATHKARCRCEVHVVARQAALDHPQTWN
jgi:hypothetical protein